MSGQTGTWTEGEMLTDGQTEKMAPALTLPIPSHSKPLVSPLNTLAPSDMDLFEVKGIV